MAVGTNAVASNLYAIALGTNANAQEGLIALARDTVSAERSLTVGLGANAASSGIVRWLQYIRNVRMRQMARSSVVGR